jgi:hypothetical protein
MDGFVADVLANDPLLSASEVAAVFGVDPKTVSRWTASRR